MTSDLTVEIRMSAAVTHFCRRLADIPGNEHGVDQGLIHVFYLYFPPTYLIDWLYLLCWKINMTGIIKTK